MKLITKLLGSVVLVGALGSANAATVNTSILNENIFKDTNWGNIFPLITWRESIGMDPFAFSVSGAPSLSLMASNSIYDPETQKYWDAAGNYSHDGVSFASATHLPANGTNLVPYKLNAVFVDMLADGSFVTVGSGAGVNNSFSVFSQGPASFYTTSIVVPELADFILFGFDHHSFSLLGVKDSMYLGASNPGGAINLSVTAVPVPAALVLMLSGIAAVVATRKAAALRAA